MKKKNYLLSVVIPAYNEGEKIDNTIIETFRELSSCSYASEIIVVDDGSADNTAAVVTQLLKKKRSLAQHVRLVSYSPNQGKGWALRKGFEASTGKYVAFFDGDLEIGPEHIARYLDILQKEKADAVVGSKRHSESVLEYSKIRTFLSNLYYLFNRFFFRFKIKDTQSGMKVFKRSVLEKVVPSLLVKRFVFDLELLANIRRIGGKIIEAPLAIKNHQSYGTIRIIDLWYSFLDTLAVFFRLRILKYYNWLLLPAKKSKPPAVTLFILAKDDSLRLQRMIARCNELRYDQYDIVVLADKGGFSYPGCTVIETGSLPMVDKLMVGVSKAKGSVVAVLEEGCFPTLDWLTNIVSYLTYKEVGAVTGPVIESMVSGFWNQVGGWVSRHPFVSGSRFKEYFLLRQRYVEDSHLRNFAITKRALRAIKLDDAMPALLKKRFRREYLDSGQLLYSPDLVSYAESPHLFKEYFARVAYESYEKGRCCHKAPEKYCRIRWFFPSFFLIALVLGALFAALSAIFTKIFCGGLLLFFVALVISAGFVRRFYFGFVAAVAVLADYGVRGVHFLRGVFARRALRK